MAKRLAIVFGIVFVVMGLLGFIPNPFVGMGKVFDTNLAHDLLHILLGIVLLVAGSKSSSGAATTMKVVAMVCVLVAILGFVMGPGKLFHLIQINSADNWLYLVLAIGLFAASMTSNNQPGQIPPTMG